MNKRVTIEVPPSMHKRLKAKAVEEEKSIKDILLRFLEEYLYEDSKT